MRVHASQVDSMSEVFSRLGATIGSTATASKRMYHGMAQLGWSETVRERGLLDSTLLHLGPEETCGSMKIFVETLTVRPKVVVAVQSAWSVQAQACISLAATAGCSSSFRTCDHKSGCFMESTICASSGVSCQVLRTD